MNVSFDKIQSKLSGWAIVTLATDHARRVTGREQALIQDVPGWENLNADGKMDVKLVIDGVEIPFLPCMEELEKQDNQRIADKAVELLKEQFAEISNRLYYIEQDAVRVLQETLRQAAEKVGTTLYFNHE